MTYLHTEGVIHGDLRAVSDHQIAQIAALI